MLQCTILLLTSQWVLLITALWPIQLMEPTLRSGVIPCHIMNQHVMISLTKFVNPCLQLNGITTVLRIEHRVLILPTHLLAFLGCNYIFSLKVRFRLNAFQRGILYSAPEVLWPPLHWLITRSIPPRSNSSRSNSYQNRIEFSCRIGWHFLATCIMIATLKLMSHPK